MQRQSFRPGWLTDWSCDPSARRAWHVSGVVASVRGRCGAGLPIVRLDGQRRMCRRTWSADALRAEAYVLCLAGFDPAHPSLRFSDDGSSPTGTDRPARERCIFWLTPHEADQVAALLRRLRAR